IDEEEADGGERDDVELDGRQQPVDEERHGDREGKLQKARHDGGREIQREQAAVRAVIGGKTLQEVTHRGGSLQYHYCWPGRPRARFPLSPFPSLVDRHLSSGVPHLHMRSENRAVNDEANLPSGMVAPPQGQAPSAPPSSADTGGHYALRISA